MATPHAFKICFVAPALAEALLRLPSFYYLEIRAALGSCAQVVVVRRDPSTGEAVDWGHIDVTGLASTPVEVIWNEGCPAPQFAVIPAPPPDLSDETEFPTSRILDTVGRLVSELVARGGTKIVQAKIKELTRE